MKTEQGVAHPVLRGLPSEFSVHSGHSDLVTAVPSGCELILENERTRTQAFQLTDLPVMTVQFHPDMTGSEARTRLLAYREGFSDRIETDAQTFAERFAIGKDESQSLIERFFSVHGWASRSARHPDA